MEKLNQKIQNASTTDEVLKEFILDFDDSKTYKKYFNKWFWKAMWKD